jgi:hypothetical protein
VAGGGNGVGLAEGEVAHGGEKPARE